jgi:HEAT repeat protein
VDLAPLLEGLKHPNPGLRATAAMELRELGPAARPATPALAEALKDRSLNVRYWAATALAAIGPDAREAVPALLAALRTVPDPKAPLDGPLRYYPDLRAVSAEALGAIGPAARAALPALRQALEDEHPDVRAAAQAAITKVEGSR